MRRGAVIGIAVAVGAAVVAGGAAAWWILSSASGAEAVANDFMAAVAARDGQGALALVDGVPDAAAHAAAALDGADELIESWEVDVDDMDGAVVADVTFELQGVERTASFTLVERDGRWRVAADALGSVTPATTMGDAVRIGGVLLPAGAETMFLPAGYEVVAAPVGLLDGSTRVAVIPGRHEKATVEASLSSDAAALAQEQLDAYAEDCARPAAAVPDQCGLRVPWAADLATLSSIAFRIEKHPVVAIAADGRSFAATDGAIVATATGTTRDGEPGAFTYRSDDWALRGEIAFQGDEMVLEVR